MGEGVARALLLLALLSPQAHAVSSPAELMADPRQEARAEAIGHQLRCLVCQNESVEESEADLARDLRRIIRTRVAAGDSDRQIIDWMTERYGNFVRLRHNGDYGTAYGHLSRFAAGIRPGTRVTQGEVIGYVGATGHSIGMRSFGASAPLKDLQKKFGFTPENVVAAAREQVRLSRRQQEGALSVS